MINNTRIAYCAYNTNDATSNTLSSRFVGIQQKCKFKSNLATELAFNCKWMKTKAELYISNTAGIQWFSDVTVNNCTSLTGSNIFEI